MRETFGGTNMSARIQRTACLVAGLALAVAAFAPAAALGAWSTGYGGWRWRNPRPQGNTIRDVKAIGSTRAWAVGDAGTILKSTTSGRSWKQQSSHVMKDLFGVDFVDSTHGWAVGGNTGSGGAVVLKTTDGGTTWTSIAGLPLPGTVKPLSVDFVDRSLGWIGCSDGSVYKSTDHGNTWVKLTVPLTAPVTSLKFISSKTGWVCGRGDFEIGGDILKTTDGGTSWHEYAWTPGLGDDGECVTAMAFATKDIGWFGTSEGRLFKTTDRGAHWKYKYSTHAYQISDLNFSSTSRGWMATQGGPRRTTDGGATWKKPSGADPNSSCIARFSSSVLIGMGRGGYTFRSTNSGASWSRQGSGISADFVGTAFGDALHGWFIDDTGLMLRTYDGGVTRSRQTVPDDVIGLDDISAPSASVGWACGAGDIIRTTNSGATWSLVRNGAPWTYSISAADAQHAISVGEDGHALWTVNGGANWTDVATGVDSLRHVEMASTTVAYATGDDGVILRTANGGASWSPRNVAADYVLTGVDFVSDNEGWVVGVHDDRPLILHTTNGGTNWTPQSAGIELGGLSSVKFLDASHGIASGDSNGFGITMSTTDGGTTWTRTYSGTHTLYDCAFPSGSLQIMSGANAVIARNPQL